MPQKIKRLPNEKEKQMKMQALETVRDARMVMLDKFPFLGHLSMRLKLVTVLDERLPIAATDGKVIYFNAYVIEHPQAAFGKKFRSGSLKDKYDTAVAILAHEVWHCALLHFARGQGKDNRRFNIAADIEIGHLLEKSKIPNLSAARCSLAVPGMSAEEIYDLINTEVPPKPSSLFSKIFPFLGKKQSAEENTDDTSSQNEENSSSEESRDKKIKGKYAEGHYSRTKDYDPDCTIPDYGNKNIQDPDYTPDCEWAGEEFEKIRRKWQDAVRKTFHRYGLPGEQSRSLPGNMNKVLYSEKKHTLDWKQLLLDHVSQMFGGERQWIPPNRRYVWQGLYLPGRSKQQTIELVIALDTSGSTIEDLPDFISELRGMTTAFGEYKLTVIQCDTKIHSIKEYSNDDPLPEKGLKFHGMGGTNLCPPFQYVEEKEIAPTVLIYFTDGYGNAPPAAPDYPVIWCLTKGGKVPAKWGTAVNISS